MIDNTYTCYYPSPLGLIQVSFTAQSLYSLNFLKGNKVDDNLYRCLDFTDRGLRQMYNLIYDQLNGYFTGNRKEFDLPLSLRGTRFQVEVWQQ
ncbi:MAG: cysteine methyltransferase, partial [Bacillota bacterium]